MPVLAAIVGLHLARGAELPLAGDVAVLLRLHDRMAHRVAVGVEHFSSNHAFQDEA